MTKKQKVNKDLLAHLKKISKKQMSATVIYLSKFDPEEAIFLGMIGNFLAMMKPVDKDMEFILHNINTVERLTFQYKNERATNNIRINGKKMQKV